MPSLWCRPVSQKPSRPRASVHCCARKAGCACTTKGCDESPPHICVALKHLHPDREHPTPCCNLHDKLSDVRCIGSYESSTLLLSQVEGLLSTSPPQVVCCG